MNQGVLKPNGYVNRVVDTQLAKLLDLFGAVEITGTMWCGKTWTALSYGNSVTRIGLAGSRFSAEADPSTALIGSKPHVIDEWQDVPEIWDEVRMTVDAASGEPGLFILTGSSEPNKQNVHHSGAGRIAKLHMRTMSLFELGISTGSVSLSGLFDKRFEPQLVQQKLAPLAEPICKGGWPALIKQSIYNPEYCDSYFDALFDISIPRKGLNKEEARRIALSLARNIGTAATYATLAADAGFSVENSKSSAEKVSRHIQALEELYVLESLNGWDAPIRSKSRLRTKPKRYFSDPSLAASLLGITPQRLIEDGQLFGVLFESLCIHDLLVYAQAIPGAKQQPLYYYRDSDGLEADAIIEMRDGRWVPIEIKLGDNKVPEALSTLARLKAKIAANPAARNPEPEFSAIIVGAGEYARYDTKSNTYIIPLTVLGA